MRNKLDIPTVEAVVADHPSHLTLQAIDYKVNTRATAKYALGTSIPAFVVEHVYEQGRQEVLQEAEYKRQLNLAERYDYSKKVDYWLHCIMFVMCGMLAACIFYDQVYGGNAWMIPGV